MSGREGKTKAELAHYNPATVVYFALAESVGMVKIGYTSSLKRRLTDIRIGCPVHVRMAGCVMGGPNEERQLQLRFHEYWSHGEWFRFEGALAEFVNEHAFE